MPAQLCSLVSSDPNSKSMPAVLQSTIDLLETELVKARATLQDIQPNAVTAYRENLIARAPEFFYGSRRLTPKEVGLVPDVREIPSEEEVKVPQIPANPSKRTTLMDLLANTLVLDRMAPYLSVPSLLSLASTSRFLRSVVTDTPYVFRHLDLTECRGAQLENVTPDSSQEQDDSLTEDEFYSAPVAGIFANLERRSILQDVRTLVLDGLPVPADLVSEIVLSDRFNVSILSIRECRHLNERKLIQVLQHAVRPTRPKGTPKVKGIYHFTPVKTGPMSRSRYRDWWSARCTGRRSSQVSDSGEATPPEQQVVPTHCQNAWYGPSGKLLKGSIEDAWAQTIQKCEGIITFDAILCRGPRHNVDLYSSTNQGPQPEGRLLGPAIATVAIGPSGCDGCHGSPEGLAIWGQAPDEYFPLLAPPPLHSSALGIAKRPALFPDVQPVLNARCADCLTDRWCHRCNKWFCDDCLPRPDRLESTLSPHQTAVRGRRSNRRGSSSYDRTRLGYGVSKDCWECGPTCAACKLDSQRTCQSCQGDYCIEHNEGCCSTMCDWCNTSARHRMRDFY